MLHWTENSNIASTAGNLNFIYTGKQIEVEFKEV